jgi:copper chaperone
MKLSVPGMTCDHCKATVERTIIDLDSSADVNVNLRRKTVDVSTTAPAEAIINALGREGYPATLAR